MLPIIRYVTGDGTGITSDMSKIERIKTDSCEMEYFKFGQGEKTMVILPGLSVISVMKSAHAVEEA